MAIEWTPPQGEYVNQGDTARSWMMPGGGYINEAAAAPTPPSGAIPVLIIVT